MPHQRAGEFCANRRARRNRCHGAGRNTGARNGARLIGSSMRKHSSSGMSQRRSVKSQSTICVTETHVRLAIEAHQRRCVRWRLEFGVDRRAHDGPCHEPRRAVHLAPLDIRAGVRIPRATPAGAIVGQHQPALARGIPERRGQRVIAVGTETRHAQALRMISVAASSAVNPPYRPTRASLTWFAASPRNWRTISTTCAMPST